MPIPIAWLTIISVAEPSMRNTFVIVARKSPRGTGGNGFSRTTDLIRIVPAIILSVANPRGQDAVGGRVARDEIVQRRDVGFHGETVSVRRDDVGRITRLSLAAHFIRNIGTIGSPVASVRLFHAHALSASKLFFRASAIGFVRMIAAVVLPIAHFRFGHASLGLDAREELLRTHAGVAKLGVFVATIGAMAIIAVAGQFVRDTKSVAAFEFVVGACNVDAIHAAFTAFAVFVISQQSAFPTLTFQLALGRHGAFVGTTAVEFQTGIQRAIVGVGSHGNDAHRLTHQILGKERHLAQLAQLAQFVSADDGAEDPVSPVNIISVHGQSKRMFGFVPQYDNPIRAVHIASFDLVQSGVGPIQLLRFVIDGQTVGDADSIDDDILHLPTGQVRTLNGGLTFVPIGPVHARFAAVDGDGARMIFRLEPHHLRRFRDHALIEILDFQSVNGRMRIGSPIKFFHGRLEGDALDAADFGFDDDRIGSVEMRHLNVVPMGRRNTRYEHDHIQSADKTQ